MIKVKVALIEAIMEAINDIVYMIFVGKFMMYWPAMRSTPQPMFTCAFAALMIGSLVCRLYTEYLSLALFLASSGTVMFFVQCRIWMRHVVANDRKS